MTEKRAKPKRIIGIDYGLARLGLAFSDEKQIIAFPVMTLQAETKAEATAAKLIAELQDHAHKNNYEIAEIVIGLPLMMSGKMGFLADEVKHFVELLRKLTSVPIITWDERLTTVQAERSTRESSMTRKKRSKVIDKVAAVIILQNYLDFKRWTSGQQWT